MTLQWLIILVSLFPPVFYSQEKNSSSIQGRVYSLYGDGVAGAIVGLEFADGRQIVFTKTDQAGWFDLNKLPSGNLVVTINQQGFKREIRRIVLAANQQVYLEFGLKLGILHDMPTYEVGGVVRKSDGSVLQDAGVTLISLFDRDLHYLGRSDKNGRYRIFVDTGGQFVISVTYPGAKADAKVVILPEASLMKPTTLDFTLTERAQ